MFDDFELTIGLEVHVQLATQTKLFCGCSTIFGKPSNTQVCPICLGMPGTLPVLNLKALELGVRAALSLNCCIASYHRFDRKNYFYPDLPKGYQITQYQYPLALNGWLIILSEQKKIRIARAHLEEDAGKLIHSKDCSYVDFNRAGIPLLEIVTYPDMSSSQEAYSYLTQLKQILQYAGVSECNMQEGSLRCDANISLHPKGTKELGTKVEIKNLNSFNYIRKALEYESYRQVEIYRKGGKIIQGTYTWLENENRTEIMRTKENVHDYRYFPDPDLTPISLTRDYILEQQNQLPEMPQVRKNRLIAQYQINADDAEFCTQDRAEADYFEECMKFISDPQEILNWLKGPIHTYLNEHTISICKFPVSSQKLAELIKLLQLKKINRTMAKEIFFKMAESGKSAEYFVQSKEKITDPIFLKEVCKKIILQFPNLIQSYKTKPNVLNSAVGQVMRQTENRADVEIVREIFIELFSIEN